MQIWIASLGPKRTIVVFYQGISRMKISRTGEDLYIIVNYAHRHSGRGEIQRRYALSMQDLPSLMELIGNESHKYSSIPKMLNAVRIWSGIECEMSSPLQTHAIKRILGILLYISLYFTWTTWTAMFIVFIKALRHINMWFRTWRGQECTWVILCQILLFRRYCHWCLWKKPDLRSLLRPWLHLSPIMMMLWKRL